MFGSAVLDTAIGLVLLFFIVSTICSNIYTIISRVLNTRGKMLQDALIKLLGPELYHQVMNHPLIKENNVRRNFLTRQLEYQTKPDYIPPEVFARVLTEILEEASYLSDPSRKLPINLPDPVRYFLEQLQEKRMTVDKLVWDVQKWFEDRMSSLTRIFREQAQVVLGTIAVFVVLVFNINTITIGGALWEGPTLREAVVASADTQLSEPDTVATGDDGDVRGPVEIYKEDLAVLGLPIGWTKQELEATKLMPGDFAYVDNPDREIQNTFVTLVGWIVTIGAAMFGGPFWYDLMRNLMGMRGDKK